MKTIHYPNKLRSYLVTIVPMAFTSKSPSLPFKSPPDYSKISHHPTLYQEMPSTCTFNSNYTQSKYVLN